MQEQEWLTLREAADALGISEVSARRWVKSGKLEAAQPGRKYLIPRSAVEELLSPKAPGRSSPELSLFSKLEDERRAAWEDAVEQARRLRETGRARMWKTLSEWRASKGRGEPYATRRQYLDEMGNLLQEVYDADDALGWAYIEAASSPTWAAGSDANVPSYLREQSRETTQFYGELLGLVRGARLSVLTGEDAAAAKQHATEHAQSETRPLRVEEPAA